jgi:hypothetical protein
MQKCESVIKKQYLLVQFCSRFADFEVNMFFSTADASIAGPASFRRLAGL